MAMSSNLARSLPDSPAGDFRPASLLSKMASRGRRPSQLVTSAVSADEAPANMSPGSVVGDMERGTLAEKTGRSDGQLTSRWRELHGSNDWQGLLDPIDTVLRGELIRYGEFAQACYDSFDYDRFSRYSGSCKYPTRTFFQDVGHSLGSALAMISAFDIAESGANVSPSAGGKKAPVCVFSFAGPRVGNTRFKERFEGELGVKALRIRNVHDMVPKVPGFLFNEVIFPAVLLRVADALRVPSVYTHVGVELALDHIVSPFLKPTGDLASYHNLEAHLHLLDGYRAHGQPFELGGRDPALVNKAADFLRDEHMVPPGWRQEENKGMVRTEDGRWALLQLPRDVEAHPVPDDIDIHLAALGLLVQEQDGI
ncbi:unnamed protein product [Triticum turgidum subsp. durum]|uniref:Fungal lipase-type domain-containing protein n=1 Tax=Triticum turgidum subsp. durum TaxID=4567 RepID=A0A9R0RZ77_TRITD|nr:unnamed protein product [Triticum turgidum subsp. durum]